MRQASGIVGEPAAKGLSAGYSAGASRQAEPGGTPAGLVVSVRVTFDDCLNKEHLAAFFLSLEYKFAFDPLKAPSAVTSSLKRMRKLPKGPCRGLLFVIVL
jgi:hypothetical protein